MRRLKVIMDQKKKLEDTLEELESTLEDTVDFNFSDCYVKMSVEEATSRVESKIKDLEKKVLETQNEKKE